MAGAANARRRDRLAHLRDLFGSDAARFDGLHVEALDFLFDFSRQRLTAARSSCCSSLRGRAASRSASRRCSPASPSISPRTAPRCTWRCATARTGRCSSAVATSCRRCWRARQDARVRHRRCTRGGSPATGGARYTDVVNIGIGGSDLGIVMATEALARYRNRAIRLHCVSNVDGVELADVLEQVDPGTHAVRRLLEDLHDAGNADATRASRASGWSRRSARRRVTRQFVAVSTNAAAMDAFGIAPERRFTMWDWVGGRYSLWSAVGLSIALALGMDPFEQMLAGGHDMDEHFRSAPLGGKPAGADGPDRRLEHELPRRDFARGAALRPAAASLPGLPAAARDGIERQERHARRARPSTTRRAR